MLQAGGFPSLGRHPLRSLNPSVHVAIPMGFFRSIDPSCRNFLIGESRAGLRGIEEDGEEQQSGPDQRAMAGVWNFGVINVWFFKLFHFFWGNSNHWNTKHEGLHAKNCRLGVNQWGFNPQESCGFKHKT